MSSSIRRSPSTTAAFGFFFVYGLFYYSEIYSGISEDTDGLHQLFKQFSFSGGIGSHCTPETPGSIHEGG